MEREGFDIPLLIGGATTSRVHTAVKIHPAYNQRPDGLCHRRLARGRRRLQPALAGAEARPMSRRIQAEYAKVAAAHRRSEADKQRLPLAKARANAFKPDWAGYQPPKPTFLGTRVFRTTISPISYR
jgi:5-methyltetrahydrofolate--homocysteine methyltransferase